VIVWCDGLKEKGVSRKCAHDEDGDSDDKKASKWKKQPDKDCKARILSNS